MVVVSNLFMPIFIGLNGCEQKKKMPNKLLSIPVSLNKKGKSDHHAAASGFFPLKAISA